MSWNRLFCPFVEYPIGPHNVTRASNFITSISFIYLFRSIPISTSLLLCDTKRKTTCAWHTISMKVDWGICKPSILRESLHTTHLKQCYRPSYRLKSISTRYCQNTKILCIQKIAFLELYDDVIWYTPFPVQYTLPHDTPLYAHSMIDKAKRKDINCMIYEQNMQYETTRIK